MVNKTISVLIDHVECLWVKGTQVSYQIVYRVGVNMKCDTQVDHLTCLLCKAYLLDIKTTVLQMSYLFKFLNLSLIEHRKDV